MAKLKTTVKSLEEVDEKYRDLYEKQGEEFVFAGADETDSVKKIAEFRNTNRTLFNQLKEMEKKLSAYGEVEPEQLTEAMQALQEKQKNQEKALLDNGEIETLFAKRFEAAAKEHEKVLSAKDAALRKTQEETAALKHKLGTHLIDAEVHKAVMKAGKLRDGALDDVISRARKVWALDDHNNIVPRKNGETLFGRDGDQLTIEEWALDLPTDAPHLFEASRGGGAEGSTNTKKEQKLVDNDPVAIGRNLEAIAKGNLQVRTS